MFAGLTAGATSAVFAIVGKMMSQKLFEAILKKLIIKLMRHLASLTINDTDDGIVEDVVKAIKA